MLPLPDALTGAAALFHCCSGGFSLLLCTYVLIDANSNDTHDLDQVVAVRVTALNGVRFCLRAPDDIRRFLAAVGRLPAGVAL